MKKYLLISDIHGYSQSLSNQLNKIIESGNCPEKVICLGDINGSPELDAMQKVFYNKIVNPLKELLKTNSDPTDEEINLSPIGNGKTICDGVQELWNIILGINSNIGSINLAHYAKELSQYTHYGHFVSCLPAKVTDTIKNNMIESVTKTLSILSAFIDAGSQVYIVEGNWDVSSPPDFYPTPSECKRLPIEERALYLKDFVQKIDSRIHFVDKITEIEDDKNHFFFLPFDEAINYKSGRLSHPDDKKQVVLISHAQVIWSAIKGDTPMTGEGKKIEEKMRLVLNDLLPDMVIHGHLHDEAKDYSVFMEEKPVMVIYLPEKTIRLIDFN